MAWSDPLAHSLAALADVRDNGAGERYLIQHSAGSGKSNSITWLSHQLIGVKRSAKEVFDSAIVVTDARILDAPDSEDDQALHAGHRDRWICRVFRQSS